LPHRHKQDIVDSLRGIAAVIAMLLVFIAILGGIVLIEWAILG
jgi:hypothetical protein